MGKPGGFEYFSFRQGLSFQVGVSWMFEYVGPPEEYSEVRAGTIIRCLFFNRHTVSDIEQAIQDAIATLPEKCREVFMMSKIDGLKNREIAEKLNISEKTVERHMSIALRKLRDELDWVLQIILFFSVSHWG